jgi:hypothetical protein
MTAPSTSDSRLVDENAIRRWVDLSQTADRRARGVLDTASAIADAAIRELGGLPRRGTWCRIALAAHQQLTAASEPAPECLAESDRIRDWLDSPCGMPNFENEPVIDYWEYEDFSEQDGPDLPALVENAQHAAVFGIPGHPITAWYIADDEDSDLDGFLVTVDTPAGQRLASSWLPYHTVMPSGVSGADAVVATLTNLTPSVDEALRGAAAKPTDTPATVEAPRAARAFPFPGTAAPATPPQAPAPVWPTQPGPHR